MAIFRWQGVSPRGETIGGEMEAPTRDAVLARLRAQRIQPLPAKVKERGKGLDRDINIPGFGESVKTKDIVVFTRQLGTMIDAGLPIVQCLDILAAQTENKKLRTTIRQLKDDVESGSTFTEALKKHPKLFDDLFVNMIAAGEIGGILDNILQRLSSYMEKAMKLKAKIKGAMIYPVTIITVAAGVTTVLLIWVIPVFAELFSSFGQEHLCWTGCTFIKEDNQSITWCQADALNLPFDNGSFDTVVCQFGVMFFPDRVAGYAEARRVMKPGGRFLDRIPHGYYDYGVIRNELVRAGFTDVSIIALEGISSAPSPRHPAIAYCQGTPLRNEIEARDASLLDYVTDRATAAIAARFGTGAVTAKTQGHIVAAAR